MVKKWSITITEKERLMILNALGIAAEDGSIYGGRQGREIGPVNAMIDRISSKLRNPEAAK